jgi:ferrochelatase
MAYGTPTGPEDVEAYYTRIRHGRPPTPEQLADLERRYQAIGGSSPLAERTMAQATALAARLESKHHGEFVVAVGTKYAAPSIEDGARSLLDGGVHSVVGLVLAPHESSMSTGQYHDRARTALAGRVSFSAVGAWWGQPEFVALVAQRVTDALSQREPDERADALVVFTAHSLPTRILDNGETYADQLTETASLVASRAGLDRHAVAWQSAGRTADPWIGPDIKEVLAQLAAEGERDVIVCPVGFVADHLEVLYDIDVEAMGIGRDLGIRLSRTASLNDDPRFIHFLATLVEDAA